MPWGLNTRPCIGRTTSWSQAVSVVCESLGIKQARVLLRKKGMTLKGCHCDLVRLEHSSCYGSCFRAKRTGSPFRTCLEHGLTGNSGVSHRVMVLMASYGTKSWSSRQTYEAETVSLGRELFTWFPLLIESQLLNAARLSLIPSFFFWLLGTFSHFSFSFSGVFFRY